MNVNKLNVNKPNSGVAQLGVILVVAGIAVLAGFGYLGLKKLFSPFGDDSALKAAVTQVNTLQKQVVADHQQLSDLQKQRDDAKAADDTAKDKEIRYVQTNTTGAGEALKDAPASPQVKLAAGFITRANTGLDAAIGALPQDQQDQVKQIVAEELSGVQSQLDAANAVIAKQDQQLTTDKSDRDAATATQVQLQAKQSTLLEKSMGDEQKLSAATDNAKKLADEKDGLLAKIASLTLFLGILIGTLFLLHWVLPILGKAFPQFAPFAKIAAAAIAVPLHLLHEAEKTALKDAHALTIELYNKAKGALEAEQAAHTTTKAALVTALTSVPALSAPAPVSAPTPVSAPVHVA